MSTATAKGSTLEAALISSPSSKTVTLSLSVAGTVPERPSEANAQAEALPVYTEEHVVPSATNEPVTAPQIPSRAQTQGSSVSSETPVSRGKETRDALGILKACKPPKKKRNKKKQLPQHVSGGPEVNASALINSNESGSF